MKILTIAGNYKVENGDSYHLVSYEECMQYMKNINSNCPNGR